MVPATISEVDNWLALAQFLGQKYTVHFFELPGHGKSTKFRKKFTSEQVAKTVEDFMDHLGYKRSNLMGFSFGGILTLKTLIRLHDRIDDVILFAPCVTKRAMLHKGWQISFMRGLARIMRPKISQDIMLSLMHSRTFVNFILWLLSRVGNVEVDDEQRKSGMRRKLLALPASTLDVLVYQVNEILNADFSSVKSPFKNRLFFAMSARDPLLSYKITRKEVERLFPKIIVETFDFPYHQPPKPFTFDELNTDYGKFLDLI
jgi:pimeloyl-ACP methyl ester carboxylesterase